MSLKAYILIKLMACTSALFVVIAIFFFFDLNLKFQPKVCHVCHDMTQNPQALMILQLIMLKDMIVELTFDSSLKTRLWI